MRRSNSLGVLIEHLLVNPQGGITERVWTVCASLARCCRWDHGMTAKASAVSIGSELLLFHCICFLFWEATSRTSAKSCFTRKATDTTNEHLGGSFPRFSGSSRGQQWYSHMYFSYLVFGALRTLRGWFALCVMPVFLTDPGLKLKCSHGQLWFRNCFHLWGSVRQSGNARACVPISGLIRPVLFRTLRLWDAGRLLSEPWIKNQSND